MATLAKSIKDVNGNVILPKTRANWVYCNDNITVETKLSNIPSIDPSSIIYSCTHMKDSTVHNLSCINLPNTQIVHLSFIATSDYITGDSFKINNVDYTAKLYSLEDLPDGIFMNTVLVNIDIDTLNHVCFFKSGGVNGPPEEPTDEPASYSIIQAFTTDTTWVVPETKWYRIIAIGRSGNGGYGGSSGSITNRSGGWGAGGNVGGIACSTLLLEKGESIQITVNESMTSFGPNITATIGGNGGAGGYNSNEGDVIYGAVSSQIGDGFGGNKANVTGMQGFSSSMASTDPNYKYLAWGGWFQSDIDYINRYFVPNDRIQNYCGAYVDYDKNGKSYYQWVNLAVQVSGGGGGGVGGNRNSGTGSGGIGQPGVLIIEKAVK